ncbi:hypothetical protein N9I30_01220 [Flavobacteriales bacterium]|nr:hypothetical protein [Flavobacteriales bacterium]
MDGVITYKEREVIFRKSKELGVPEDECEIILEGMIQKYTNDNPKPKTNEDIQHTLPSNEHTNFKSSDKHNGSEQVDFSNFISIHSSKKGVFGRRFILDLEKTFKSINNKLYVQDKVREVIEPLKDKIIFKFSHSFVVGEDFLISVESGKKVPLPKVNDLELKDGKTFSKSGFFLDDEWFGDFPSMDNEGGKELFYLFKKYINENLENDKSTNENNNQESDNEKISKKENGKVLEKDLIIDDKKYVELGVPEDECEIIHEGIIEQHKKNSPSSKTTIETPPSTSSEEENKSQNDGNREEGEYDENGNKTGVWKSYFQDEIQLKTTYVKGKKHLEDFYDEKENKTRSISYDNDGDPEWEFTWENGEITNTKDLGIEKRENKEKEREKEEEEISKVFKKELLNSISFENITNPNSKLFELLSNEQFKCSYLFYKSQIEIRGGISNTKQLEDSILGLKYIVIEQLFSSFFYLLIGDHTIFPLQLYRHKNNWFYFEEKTHHDTPRPGFPNGVPIPYKGYVPLGKDNWGVFQDKNGWLFNPFRDEILIYYGNNFDNYPKTDEYDLYYGNPPKFIKGSLFKKPVFLLGKDLDDMCVRIKSNKLCEESEKYYNYWYRFLKTIEHFKKESVSNKSFEYKLELENSFEKWSQLETHFKEVNNILKSKESEIQNKEKEFHTNFIQDFIRTLNFIDENIKNSRNLNIRFQGRIERKTYESTEFIEQLNKLIESENLFITTNSSILFGLVEMIRSIIYDDRVRFYQIYEKFDKMRIFNSQYQNDVLNSLNSINDNLVELNSNIETLTNTIDKLGKELISSIRELKFEVSYLNDNITGQLQNISTKLDVNNLLNVVQTYQLWRINSNTKSISKKLN